MSRFGRIALTAELTLRFLSRKSLAYDSVAAMSENLPNESRQGRPYLASLAVVAASGALDLLLSRLGLGDPWDHAPGHAVMAVAAVLLLVLVNWRWPRPLAHPASRMARLVLMVGLGTLGLGQALESAGAFGFSGNRQISRLATLHDFGLNVGVVGLLLTMLGAVLTAIVGVAARYNLLGTKWLTVGVGIAVAAVILFIIGAFVFGY